MATTLDDAIARHAAANPGRIAVVCGDEILTYGELNARADRIAERLRHRCVGPETLVGICVERSAQMLGGLLGILKAGGAYVALDPAYPEDRLTFMLRDTGAPVVVTQRSVVSAIPVGDHDVVLLDDDTDPAGEEPAATTGSGSSSDPLAYVTYTSGSTGMPKGVLVTHASVLNLVRDQNYVTVTPDDRVAALATLSFDASTFEIWAPLVNGATCVLYTFSGEDVSRLVARMNRDAISILHLTSPVFRVLGPEHFRSLTGVRSLLFGGDAVRAELGAVAAQCFAGELVHLYGPSETTGFATYHDVRSPEPGAVTIPIGVPIRNVETRVLSPDGTAAADGTAGELYIGGAGVARGYLNHPELTAERFVPNRGDRPSLYRTGDLVRRCNGGALQFLGRIDRQVKVRGFRIEPGEIEYALTRHHRVDDAVVVARDDGVGDKRLDAYVVLSPGSTGEQDLADTFGPQEDKSTGDGALVAQIRRQLAETLPRHQIPASITVIAAIPLTPNLKIDEARLPPLAESRSGAARELAQPRSRLEDDLLQICRDVLGTTELDVDDDFFDVGGDSISALLVVSEIERTTGVRVEVGAFFEHPTIRALSRAVEGSEAPRGVESDLGRPQ